MMLIEHNAINTAVLSVLVLFDAFVVEPTPLDGIKKFIREEEGSIAKLLAFFPGDNSPSAVR